MSRMRAPAQRPAPSLGLSKATRSGTYLIRRVQSVNHVFELQQHVVICANRHTAVAPLRRMCGEVNNVLISRTSRGKKVPGFQ